MFLQFNIVTKSWARAPEKVCSEWIEKEKEPHLTIRYFHDLRVAQQNLLTYLQFRESHDFANANSFVQLLVEFVPSLTITGLYMLLPPIFKLVVRGEDYVPETQMRVTLWRTVFLRLASLAMLVAGLYAQVVCRRKDDCNVGIAPTCYSLPVRRHCYWHHLPCGGEWCQ